MLLRFRWCRKGCVLIEPAVLTKAITCQTTCGNYSFPSVLSDQNQHKKQQFNQCRRSHCWDKLPYRFAVPVIPACHGRELRIDGDGCPSVKAATIDVGSCHDRRWTMRKNQEIVNAAVASVLAEATVALR